MLDELNAQLKPHGLRFAPDISTASRATIGGMISNNSCGARSVMYGKTIDHVLELDVVLADGSQAHFAAADARRARRRLRGRHARGDVLSHRPAARARVRRTKSSGAIRRSLRRVGGYNLDEFVDEAKPFNLAKIIVGSEGTLGMSSAAKVNLVPLPKEKAVLADRVRASCSTRSPRRRSSSGTSRRRSK